MVLVHIFGSQPIESGNDVTYVVELPTAGYNAGGEIEQLLQTLHLSAVT